MTKKIKRLLALCVLAIGLLAGSAPARADSLCFQTNPPATPDPICVKLP